MAKIFLKFLYNQVFNSESLINSRSVMSMIGHTTSLFMPWGGTGEAAFLKGAPPLTRNFHQHCLASFNILSGATFFSPEGVGQDN